MTTTTRLILALYFALVVVLIVGLALVGPA